MPRSTTRPGRRKAPGSPRPARGKRRSLTAVAAEAARLGVVPGGVPERQPEIPGEDRTLRAGDPDVSALDAGLVGDATPVGSTPTPDQSRVDEIGRAMGIAEVDGQELRPTSEVLEARDRRRPLNEPARGRSEEADELDQQTGDEAGGAPREPGDEA